MAPSQTSCLTSPIAHEKAIAAFPGNKTPRSGSWALALEVQESPAHPAAAIVCLQYFKYCFLCVQDLTKGDSDDELE